MYVWIREPGRGGLEIDDTVKEHTKKRIIKYAQTNFAGHCTKLDIRFRMQFCYVDAYTEESLCYHMFRLRFFGDEEKWGVAFYSYAHEKFGLSVFASGDFFGTPEEAFQTAGEFYLSNNCEGNLHDR